MPNWCNNDLTLTHADPAMMQRALDGFNANAFLSEFHPVPESLKITAGRDGHDGSPEQIALVAAEAANLALHGFKNWFDWSVANWGTKWDIGRIDNPPASLDTDGALRVSFESAWAPPVEGYLHLIGLGFNVLAYYYEPGIGFCGRVNNEGDKLYEIDGGAVWVQANIPTDIDDAMGISEDLFFAEETEL